MSKQLVVMILTTAAVVSVLFWAYPGQPLQTKNVRETCNNFNNDNGCRSQDINNPAEFANRVFQTPPKGDSLYRDSYQDYSTLQGYVQIKYSADQKSANLHVYTKVNPKVTGRLTFSFGGKEQDSADFAVSSPTGVLEVIAYLKDGTNTLATLKLEPVDFVWNHPSVNVSGNYEGGQKGAIVELFGWPWEDIEQECEFIAKSGYLGVKIFPPNESILDFEHPEEGQMNPWYWLYQPVSYKLTSRMGTVTQLRSMINTCRSKGVRIYADAVVNHMVGSGNDMFPSHCSGSVFWGNKNSSAGSPFYSQGYAYTNWTFTGVRAGNEFPAIPYGPMDFHCDRVLNSWTDGFILNAGWLVGLTDLNTETDYVRQRIADYITELLSIGVSGIRIDAAKHISPENLANILKKVADNFGGSLPGDFIAYLEVILGGEKGLLMCDDNWYNYGVSFNNFMKKVGLSDNDINKIKIWASDYPKEHPACGWVIPSTRFAIQQDCHDDQNPGSSSRDMQDFGSVLVKERNVEKHRNFNIQLFTRKDGDWKIRLVLSSYSFMDNGGQGFPDGHSDCSKCVGTAEACKGCTKSVPYRKAHDPNVGGYTMQDGSGWIQGAYTRVHRDSQIINAMRGWMGLNSLTNAELGLPENA